MGPDRDSDVVLVLTTVPAELDAETLVRPLIEAGLAACASLLPPMRSVYRWRGTIETADERQIILKTTRGRMAVLQAELSARHPYEVPELLIVPITGGGEAYLRWLRTETG